MAETVSVTELTPADLSETPLLRDHMAPPEARDARYEANYDRTTLWYDAFWREDRGEVMVIAPLLLNLARPLSQARILLDGRPVRLRRRRFQRHEIWRLPAPARPERLRVEGQGWAVEAAVGRARPERFAGRNVLLTISRNNDLQWVRDYALFHRKTQGAEAILFIDNGSDAYAPDDIARVIGETGLAAHVISAPVPYGPVIRGISNPHRGKFFRSAMMNLARLRYLYGARAVLNSDIDELIWSEGRSVFDMAAAHPIGFAPFRGRWRVPGPDAEPPLRHADHFVLPEQNVACPIKYAVAPGRLAGRFNWDVHRLERLPFKHRFLRQDAGYWHCAAVSTGWKSGVRLTMPGSDDIDAPLKALLKDVLGSGRARS
ncbi:hypothetical protein [Rhodovulum sulfidophilum]|uniref:hypothetical protein n=1 Tax=Rhodovulum sulfidophilum TaxID=35806 RepID=UPI000951FF56|nr:hypothetical protein [Rhodovulum sulfidophilum]OLS53790.1 hypothetical protein BV392_18575 [Rhodovulum sulfidophilum]